MSENTNQNSDDLQIIRNIPSPREHGTVVCTLSGVKDIGMNWTLYGHNNQFILVDAGSSFPPREVSGIEAVFPDPSIFKKLGKRLVGLVVTHFHEDHVGAIHRLWPYYVNCPIFAPPFATQMLIDRFKTADTLRHINLNQFRPGQDIRVGPFNIRTIPVAHSTPDSVALAIKTNDSLIIHTGDWKIDDTPGIGHRTNLNDFADIGDMGVDLMLCDSTNAHRETQAISEAQVRTAFEKIFRKTKGRVVVCSFGSNVARMASVVQAASATQRYVALAGHALMKSHAVASRLNLFHGVPMDRFLEKPAHLQSLDRRRQVLLCTGTQGEERAALTRLARGTDWRLPTLEPGDVLIHSARVIPGNEEYVNEIFDLIRASGVEIIEGKDLIDNYPVHVTGHPCRPELRALYEAVRPRTAIPMHGTKFHLKEHAKLAEGMGVKEIAIPQNGIVFELYKGQLYEYGIFDAKYVAIQENSENSLIPWDADNSVPVLEDIQESSPEETPLISKAC